MNNNQNHLSQGLKPRHVQLIALGGTIGTGLFLGSGQAIKTTGPAILLAYLIAGIACFFLMRALGELLLSGTHFRSFLGFISKYLGRKAGIVTGWTYWFCWITIAMTEITASGLYIKFWFPNFPQWMTGFIVLIILFILNSLNVSAFGETEFWFALIKIIAIVALIIAGITMAIIHFKVGNTEASFSNLFNYGFLSHGIKGFFNSFQMVIFSFVGIEIIGMTASETKNPRKEIPKCINNVPIRILLFYVGALFAILCIYPWTSLSSTSSPFVQVFKNIGIGSAATIINFVVLTAALSSCNSAIFSTGRIVYSLSSHGQSSFSKHLNTLSHNHVPSLAISFSTVIIGIAVILNLLIPQGVFTFIASVATTCFLFIWTMIILAHLKYRHLNHNKKDNLSFKMPLYPYSDYFVLAFFALIILIMMFKAETLFALIGSVVWLIGITSIVSFSNRIRQRQH